MQADARSTEGIGFPLIGPNMFPFGGIALVAFWAGVVWVWMVDGPKIPLIFVALWILGALVIPRMHWHVNVFMPYNCILAVILLLIGKYKTSF